MFLCVGASGRWHLAVNHRRATGTQSDFFLHWRIVGALEFGPKTGSGLRGALATEQWPAQGRSTGPPAQKGFLIKRYALISDCLISLRKLAEPILSTPLTFFFRRIVGALYCWLFWFIVSRIGVHDYKFFFSFRANTTQRWFSIWGQKLGRA